MKNTSMKIEICTNSVQSAVTAQENGAQRIELCCNLTAGGLTPSAGTIQLARKWLAIDIHVLIRPRTGDFYYSDIEMETILKDILYCREQGIDGIFFGVLHQDHTIDIERNAILLEAARPMKATFHRAFDCVPNPEEGLEQLIELGFERVLTSGQQASAMAGKQIIKDLVQQADQRILILPGGGLNQNNIKEFISFTNVKEVHLSAKKAVASGAEGLFEATYFETSEEEVAKVVEEISSISRS